MLTLNNLLNQKASNDGEKNDENINRFNLKVDLLNCGFFTEVKIIITNRNTMCLGSWSSNCFGSWTMELGHLGSMDL